MLAVGGGAGALLWYGGRGSADKEWRGVASVTLKLPPAEPMDAPPAASPPVAAAPPALPSAPAAAEPQNASPPSPTAPSPAPPSPVLPMPAPPNASAPHPAPPVAAPPPPPVPSIPRPSPSAAPAPPPGAPAAKPPTTQAMAPAAAPAKPTVPAPSFPTRAGEPKLAPPDPALGERVKDGVLPVIARDGRQAWQVYARPFDKAEKRARIAVVLANMGLSASATEQAIRNLPGGVTLAFAPFADRLPEWIDLARRSGHEVLLHVPMEPDGYPRNDPGPKTLLTSISEAENQDRLEWVLTRAVGYVGVANLSGGRFAGSNKDLQPVLKVLRQRGLLFLERAVGRQTVAGELAKEIGLPFVAAQALIDADPARSAIDSKLAELERAAKRDGSAVGMALPYPVTQERLAVWANGLEARGLVLAPISATATAGK